MNTNQFIPYKRDTYETEEMIQRSQEFRDWLDNRRTVRTFSDKPVPKEVMENVIMSASSAPSGAHKQPWTFCVISNSELKSVIRKAAEEEEHTNYHGRMSEEWLEDLQAFDTDWNKPFIDIAPWVIVIFRKYMMLGRMEAEKPIIMCRNLLVLLRVFYSLQYTKWDLLH